MPNALRKTINIELTPALYAQLKKLADDKSICYTRLKIIYSAFWLRVLLHLAIEKGPPL